MGPTNIIYQRIFIIGVLLLLFLQFSCEFDPEEPIPGYLYVEEVRLKTYEGQGAPTHLIKDLWIILDSVGAHGIYPVRTAIPVIPNNPQKLSIFPGIRVNGVKNESVIYEAYKSISLTHTFTPGKVDTFSLEFEYTKNTKFPVIEDFETTPNWQTLDTNMHAIKGWTLAPADDTIFGSSVGAITLLPDSVRSHAELVHGEWIPSEEFKNKRVFMEVDIQSTRAQMAFGFQIKEGSHSFKTLNAFVLPDSIGKWRKFYFDFTTIIRSKPNSYYRILYFTSLDTSEFKQAVIKMDNLKIVTF